MWLCRYVAGLGRCATGRCKVTRMQVGRLENFPQNLLACWRNQVQDAHGALRVSGRFMVNPNRPRQTRFTYGSSEASRASKNFDTDNVGQGLARGTSGIGRTLSLNVICRLELKGGATRHGGEGARPTAGSPKSLKSPTRSVEVAATQPPALALHSNSGCACSQRMQR